MRYRVIYSTSAESLETKMNDLNRQGYTLSEFSTAPSGSAGMTFLYAVMVNRTEGLS